MQLVFCWLSYNSFLLSSPHKFHDSSIHSITVLPGNCLTVHKAYFSPGNAPSNQIISFPALLCPAEGILLIQTTHKFGAYPHTTSKRSKSCHISGTLHSTKFQCQNWAKYPDSSTKSLQLQAAGHLDLGKVWVQKGPKQGFPWKYLLRSSKLIVSTNIFPMELKKGAWRCSKIKPSFWL